MSDLSIADIGAPDADLDPSGDRYAARFAGPAGEYLLSRQTVALQGFLRDLPAASILDVGGGHGQSARPLLAAGHPVTVAAAQPGGRSRISIIQGSSGMLARCCACRLTIKALTWCWPCG